MPRTAKGAHRHTELEVIQALRKLGSGTSKDIAVILNIDRRGVAGKIALLKKANRVYITDWIKRATAGDYAQVYSLVETAEDIDVPRPKPLTPTQRSTAYYRRNKLAKLLKLTKESKEPVCTT